MSQQDRQKNIKIINLIKDIKKLEDSLQDYLVSKTPSQDIIDIYYQDINTKKASLSRLKDENESNECNE
jgi:hypothetical protein